MVHPKPTTLWAVVSFISGALGCLAFLGLVLLGERYHDLANASAGVGGVWGAMHVTLAIALCLLGAFAGVVALLRIRGGGCRGRGMALTGIVLGGLPWLLSWVLETLHG